MTDRKVLPDRIYATSSRSEAGVEHWPHDWGIWRETEPYMDGASYIRADLDSFYQEKDIDALMAERDNLRSIVRAFLACPHIADRDPYPWQEPETEAVVDRAKNALDQTDGKAEGA